MQFKILDNCLFLMNLYGVHPAKVGHKTQTFLFIFYLIHFSVLIYLIVLLMIKEEFMPVEEKIDVSTSVLIQLHALLYLICLYLQRPKVQLLIEYMKQHFWDPESYTSPELKISCKKTLGMLRFKYYGYIAMMLTCASSFCYSRIALDGRHIPANMTFKSYIPPGVNFWALFVWQHIQATGAINIFTSMDFCICSIVSLTSLQFRLLRFTTMVVNTFSMLMFIYMGVAVIMLCTETYLLFCINNLADLLRIVTYTINLYIELFACFCFPSQELLDEANKLSVSLYCNTNWYKYPNYYRNILILLGKSQRRVVFNACGLLDIDLRTGMSAIKSMLSYSMFLRSITGHGGRM